MIYNICLVTTEQVTNEHMTFVKIPSNLLPSTVVFVLGSTNNAEVPYPKYVLPFEIDTYEEYNLKINYVGLGGTLNLGSWLWGTIIWTIGH